MPPRKMVSRSRSPRPTSRAKRSAQTPLAQRSPEKDNSALNMIAKRFVIALMVAVVIYIFLNSTLEDVPIGLRIEEARRPGRILREKIRAKHPVVMVPGMFCSALELWDSLPCARSNAATTFRRRMLGAGMLFTLLADPQCFLRHISLHCDDPTRDPEGIKMRVSDGYDGSDFLVPGYWVWAKMLVNLADIGYEPNLLHMAPYDFRLGPHSLEKRDSYMTRLKVQIELMHRHEGQKVVVFAHSYGCVVFNAFLNWVDEASPGWTERHIHAFAIIGGPMLGAPKSVSTLLSGEMKDTAMLPATAKVLVDKRIPTPLRMNSFRTWESLYWMYPTGDEIMWPNLLIFNNGTKLNASRTTALLRDEAAKSGHLAMRDFFNEHRFELPKIPKAPSMTVYCLYGVQQSTEVGFFYRNDTLTIISTASHDFGVILDEGDATVPLMSLGYMCRAPNGWRQHVRVKTIEFNHTQVPAIRDPRGGAYTADHVDIMGNYALITALLQISSGNDELTKDRVISDVDLRIASYLSARRQLENGS